MMAKATDVERRFNGGTALIGLVSVIPPDKTKPSMANKH